AAGRHQGVEIGVRAGRDQSLISFALMRPFLLLSTLLIAVSAFASGTLFGLRNPGDGGRQVVIVDPATGAVTPVSASISPPSPAASGVNALDASGHRLFYIATPAAEADERLFTVDTQTGALLSSPTIAGSAAAPFQSLDYDAGEAALYRSEEHTSELQSRLVIS